MTKLGIIVLAVVTIGSFALGGFVFRCRTTAKQVKVSSEDPNAKELKLDASTDANDVLWIREHCK